MEAPRDSRPFFLKGFEGRRFPRKPLTHFRVYIPKPPGGKFKLNQDEPNRKRNSQTTWIIRPRAKTANGITDSPSIAPPEPLFDERLSPRAPSPQTPRSLLAHSPECYSVSLRSKNAAAFSKQMALAISAPNSCANSVCNSPTRCAGSSQLGTSQPS